jgi:hypothetical protein
MSQFNDSSFNSGEFGSPYITPGPVLNCGTSSTAVNGVRRKLRSLSTQGTAYDTLSVRRVRRAAGSATGTSLTVIHNLRRRLVVLLTAGVSSDQLSAIRRKPYLHLVSAGTSLTHIDVYRELRRALLAAGSSHTILTLFKIESPKPVRAGLKVAPWMRPTSSAT